MWIPWRITVLVGLLALPASAQIVNGPVQNHCYQGGTLAKTSGLNSSNYLQGIIPSCTVTVYNTGTTTPATIFSNESGTPLSPSFTANAVGSVNPGGFIFWAPLAGPCFDVVLSGGIVPNVYFMPVTITDICAGGGGGGGGASHPPTNSVQIAAAAGAFNSDPNIHIDPIGHKLIVDGAGTSFIGQCGGSSGLCVTLSVNPATAAWQNNWPNNPPPTSGNNCLTAITTGSGTDGPIAVNAWSTCTLPFAFKTNPPTPPTVVNAADYGALCNYTNNDTQPIQQAIADSYAFNLYAASPNLTPMVIKLPQGSCRITAPLTFGTYGSLQGQGQSTYIFADYANWVGSDHTMIEIVANGPLAGGNTLTPRTFGHMTMVGLGDSTIPDAEAVKVVNNANTYGQAYQFGQLSFEDMAVSQVDTAFDLQDAVNTQFSFVWVNQVRIAANLNGDVIQTFFDHTYFQVGSAIGTSQNTTAYGLLVQGNNKYNAGCATHTFTCEPQGVFFHDSSIVSFDYNVDIEWCVQCDIHDNTIDVPASGITGSGADVQLGGYAAGGGIWIQNNYMGAEKANTFIVNSVFAFEGLGSDGIWIQNNEIFSNVSPGTTAGIVFQGSGPIESVHVNGNELRGLNKGISIGQSILNSEFRGNTGNTLTNELIDLANTGSPDYTGTIFEANTVQASNAVPVIREGSATNFYMGYNWSPNLVTGPQTALGVGCSITGTAIGSTCGPITMTIAIPYADTNYVIKGCAFTGASHDVTQGTIGSKANNQFTMSEIALSASATSGGTVACALDHQ